MTNRIRSDQEDNQVSFTLRGRTFTMSRQARMVLAVAFAGSLVVALGAISLTIMLTAGPEIAAVIAVFGLVLSYPWYSTFIRTAKEKEATDLIEAIERDVIDRLEKEATGQRSE